MTVSKRRFQKFFVLIIGGLMFVSSSATSLIGLVKSQSSKPQPLPTKVSAADNLKEEAKNYELVLKKEPDNSNALQGLVKTRLQLNNIDGAKQPLKKLIALKPNNKSYKDLMEKLKSHNGKSSSSTSN
jgi:predicted Zn-dependent protease